MLERQLVCEFVRGATEDRRVERGVQRRAAAQQSGILDAAGVRTTHCSSAVAYGSLRAAMPRTERDRSHEFRRFWCRMILCAELVGRSTQNHHPKDEPG